MLSKAENRQNHFMRFDVLTFFENPLILSIVGLKIVG